MELQLNEERIYAYLREVAEQLAPHGAQHTLIVVGGSLLAVHGLRASTMDIDSVRRIEEELQQAISAVAKRHGLGEHWINSSATAFAPATLDIDQCSTLLQHPRPLVLGAPLDQVFVMKLHAARDSDREDLVRLWARDVFDSPQDAVDAYWAAYPNAPDDEYLVSFVADIARSANG